MTQVSVIVKPSLKLFVLASTYLTVPRGVGQVIGDVALGTTTLQQAGKPRVAPSRLFLLLMSPACIREPFILFYFPGSDRRKRSLARCSFSQIEHVYGASPIIEMEQHLLTQRPPFVVPRAERERVSLPFRYYIHTTITAVSTTERFLPHAYFGLYILTNARSTRPKYIYIGDLHTASSRRPHCSAAGR